MRPNLLAIKVSGCHLVPVILRASSRGRQAGLGPGWVGIGQMTGFGQVQACVLPRTPGHAGELQPETQSGAGSPERSMPRLYCEGPVTCGRGLRTTERAGAHSLQFGTYALWTAWLLAALAVRPVPSCFASLTRGVNDQAPNDARLGQIPADVEYWIPAAEECGVPPSGVQPENGFPDVLVPARCERFPLPAALKPHFEGRGVSRRCPSPRPRDRPSR
jgi:hypothetical protein